MAKRLGDTPTWQNPTGGSAPAAPTIYGTSGVNSPDTYIGPGAAQGWTTPVVVGATDDAQAAIDQTVQAGGQIVVGAASGVAQLLVPGKDPVTVPIKSQISTTTMVIAAGAAAIGLYFIAKMLNKSGHGGLPDLNEAGIQMKGCDCGPGPKLAERYRPKKRKKAKRYDPETAREVRAIYKSEKQPKCRKVKKGKASFTVCGVK